MVRVGQIGGEDCLFFCYQNHCSHFATGRQCLFCNLVSTSRTYDSVLKKKDMEAVGERQTVLPSPVLDHGRIVARIDELLAGERLAITGNWFAGLSIEDCVQRSRHSNVEIGSNCTTVEITTAVSKVVEGFHLQFALAVRHRTDFAIGKKAD